MTARFSDRVELDGIQFAIAGVDADGLFHPGDIGLEPRALNTACWRGFVSEYGVVTARLHLQHLWVGLEGVDDEDSAATGAPTIAG